jgi:hypothetical protein
VDHTCPNPFPLASEGVASDPFAFPVQEGGTDANANDDGATPPVATGTCPGTPGTEESTTVYVPHVPGGMLDACAVTARHATQTCSATLDDTATCACAPGELERTVNDVVVCVHDACAASPCHTGQNCTVAPDGRAICTGCSFGAPRGFNYEHVRINSTDGSFTLNGMNPVALGLNNSLFTGFRFRIFGQTDCPAASKTVAMHVGQGVWHRSEVGIQQRGASGATLRLSTDAVTGGQRINGAVDSGTLTTVPTGIVFNGRSREINPSDHPTAGATSILRVLVTKCYSTYVQFWPVCGPDACVQGGCTCSDTAEGADSFCPACDVDSVGIPSCSAEA